MKDIPERSSLRSRLSWFAVLYLGGVLAAFMLAAALHVLVYAFVMAHEGQYGYGFCATTASYCNTETGVPYIRAVSRASFAAEDTGSGFGTGEEADEGGSSIMSKKRNPRIGSTFDDFLDSEGILEELQSTRSTRPGHLFRRHRQAA